MQGLLSGLVEVRIEARSGVPLTRQLYHSLQRAILAGRLPSGHRLPSSREMARHLKVSRNTVCFFPSESNSSIAVRDSEASRPVRTRPDLVVTV